MEPGDSTVLFPKYNLDAGEPKWMSPVSITAPMVPEIFGENNGATATDRMLCRILERLIEKDMLDDLL